MGYYWCTFWFDLLFSIFFYSENTNAAIYHAFPRFALHDVKEYLQIGAGWVGLGLYMNCRTMSLFAEAESTEVCLSPQRISTPSSVCFSKKPFKEIKCSDFCILYFFHLLLSCFLGALFACLSFLESLTNNVSSGVFNSIYAATVAWYPGFVFSLSAGLCFIPLSALG